ncbi:hypothetical protein HPB49_009800 [Dermacentor silvarum]|uniref:Uncharacterized protein n=1 Tax=Dermacentor silvarum TaxID=543639 RepID=A0ACB8DZ33_DERSI|nr:hypothetical protein HPB49_009800 [Dermacentor silvarum]
MLSFYSLVKPPKFGNRSIADGCESRLLALSDLAFRPNDGESKLEKLKKKLDKRVDDEVECEILFDHVYSMPEATHCVVYYITGYMCRELLKNTSCEQFTRGMAVSLVKADRSEASLVNLKTKGKLVHPAIHIFRVLQSAESVFQKNAAKGSANCLTIDELLEQHNFSFPCPLHKVDRGCACFALLCFHEDETVCQTKTIQ